jgi:hypothetical protein
MGGLNPYVVPIAGLPWAALLTGRFVAVEGSVHVRIRRELEIGALFDGALVRDAHRRGDSDDDWIQGVALFVDWPVGPLQIDVRAGWSPSFMAVSSEGNFALFMALGYSPG